MRSGKLQKDDAKYGDGMPFGMPGMESHRTADRV
jgi:hypothetical protein